MKMFAALTVFALSLSAFAVEKSAKADFTKLYNNFNAGSYKVDFKLVSKPTLSTAKLTTSLRQDDGQFTCTTSAKFEVGEMTFSIAQIGTNWKKVTTQKVYGEVSQTVDGRECDMSLEYLASQTALHVTVSPENNPTVLPVKTYPGYERIETYLIPFDGYVVVDTEIKIVNNSLVVNPAGLLSERSIFSRNTPNLNRMFFYVAATAGSSILSLGNGHIELR